jgi:hypothetical protein
MDGFYPNKGYLNKWYKEAIEIVELDGLDHCHIDDIDKNLRLNRNLWFDGALYFYNVIRNNLIDRTVYGCELVIQLRYGRKKMNMQNVNKITVAHIKRKIGYVSPSLYIFKKNDANYDLTLSKFHYLEKLSKQLNMNAYFLEQENYPKEFDRTIFIVHPTGTDLQSVPQ